jgi:Domain of unknown function (DUF4372)/Transposase DDE domain/Group II intron, maturase-specific domain
VTRVSSIFSQMLQLFSRTEFERAVVEHRAERHARGFSCWGQFVAMLFCHLGRAQSLGEICGGLAASEGKLRHLGLLDAPKRSTLAYANEHRPWQLYRSVSYQLLSRCREVAGTHGFRFKNKLLTLDATLIELCASVFDWAQYRRTKGAVKLHLLLDHQGLLPSFALVTEGRVHESCVARSLRFEPGTIVVFDRDYTDYEWFAALDAEGVFFVTRLKENADYGVLERRPVPAGGVVRCDEIIFFHKAARAGNLDLFLRRIEVWDEEQKRVLVFLTNHRGFAASTIAAIYRQRWQIGVSRQGHINQSVKVRPRLKDSGLVAGEAARSESETMKPSDSILEKEYAQRTRLQRTVNADVASLHAKVIEQVNASLAGWVHYFRVGNSSRAFSEVRDYAEMNLHNLLTRRKRRRKTSTGWRRWSNEYLYDVLGLCWDWTIQPLPGAERP